MSGCGLKRLRSREEGAEVERVQVIAETKCPQPRHKQGTPDDEVITHLDFVSD